MATIKELAEQVGCTMENVYACYDKEIERFAELIRQDEREACGNLIANMITGVEGLKYAEAIWQRSNHEQA